MEYYTAIKREAVSIYSEETTKHKKKKGVYNSIYRKLLGIRKAVI